MRRKRVLRVWFVLVACAVLWVGCESEQAADPAVQEAARTVEPIPATLEAAGAVGEGAAKVVTDAAAGAAGAVVETTRQAAAMIEPVVEAATGSKRPQAAVAKRILETEPKGPYRADWESLDARPTPEWFTDAKFGIFIHWGVYSVPGWGPQGQYAEWYWRNAFTDEQTLKDNEWGQFHARTYGRDFPYKDFAPMFTCEMYDPDEWADFFARSGARYVVLTSKHHEGFCLWPNAEANRTWGRAWNSVDAGPKRDLMGDLFEAGRKRGLKMGFYYSLYEWFNPLWLSDRQKYVREHMVPQFVDAVSRYAPAVIFSDGEWDMPAEDWHSPEMLAWLFNESPCRDYVVINDRWGKGARHTHGGYFTTEYGAGMADASHPWEENRGMGHSFGWNRNEGVDQYKSSRELVLILVDLVSRGGNLLLDIGPTGDGRIPVIMQQRLVDMGAWLAVNGEAIYGTQTWRQPCQWTDGKRPDQEYKEYKAKYNVLDVVGAGPKDGMAVKEAFFTRKGDSLYAILPAWPGERFVLRGLEPKAGAAATLLGVDGELPWRNEGGDMAIDLSSVDIGDMPCEHAWTIRIRGAVE